MIPSEPLSNGTAAAHSTNIPTDHVEPQPSPPSKSTTEDTTTPSNPSNPPNPDHEEYQYLNLIRRILSEGEHRPDRTGTGTLSIFAPQPLRFSLSKPWPPASPSNPPNPSPPPAYTPILPLLTTKRLFLRGILTELLWFISGSTSSTPLSAAGIHIWDGNSTRAYLDSRGLHHRAIGDLGPIYGFQWRHFGAAYTDCHADYTGQGVDQLAEVVRKLRHHPFDRRIILSAWNVGDLHEMALPPCHVLAQFYVSFPHSPRGEAALRSSAAPGTAEPAAATAAGHLSCTLYQRSADTGLGLPFNIASYALLTHMLAHACALVPATLTIVLGDAHIYLDHVEALKEQLARTPTEFPELEIRRADRGAGVVDGWAVADVQVKEGTYKPAARLGMKMSV